MPSRYTTLLPALRRFVIEAYVSGQATTLNGAARALNEVRDRDAGGVAYTTPIRTAFDHLVEKGIAVLDPELSTRGAPVYRAWNWTGLPLEGQTLRTALEPLFSAPEPREGADSPRQAVTLADGRFCHLTPILRERLYLVVSAVRAVLEARFGQGATGPKGSTGRAQLLRLCERIPAEELPTLPDLAKAAAGGSDSNRERHHTGAAFLVRYAAEHDLVALHVPAPQFAHPWGPWSQACSLSPAERSTLYNLHSHLTGAFGAAVSATPDDVTVEQANTVLGTLAGGHTGTTRRARADLRLARDLKSVLTKLGLAGRGPYRELATCSGLTQEGRSYRPRWMLPTRASSSAHDEPTAQSFDSTGALLVNLGAPPSWGDFYAWYADYCLLPSADLERLYPGVQREAKRRLTASTSRQRHQALRAYLGLAVFPAPTGLGLQFAEATPTTVFGERFEELTKLLTDAWANRSAEEARLRERGLPVPGHVVTENSATLARLIINGGMLADGLRLWAEYRAKIGSPVATGRQLEDWRSAYRLACVRVVEKTGVVSARLGGPTQKDKDLIAQDLCSLALLPAEQKRVLTLLKSDAPALAKAKTVQRYLIGALVAMGSPRVGELSLLEYGKHFAVVVDQAEGHVEVPRLFIPGDHRKNGVDHVYAMIEEIIPAAIWRWHKEHGRPELMKPWLAAGNSPHDRIFCSPESGGPFGGLPITDGADPKKVFEATKRCLSNASTRVGAQYESWRREALARRPGYRFVGNTRGQHGAHSARDHVVRMLEAVDAAHLAYLVLGHKSENRSLNLYGGRAALPLAKVMRRIIHEAPWTRAASPEVIAPTSIDGLHARTRRNARVAERYEQMGRRVEAILHQLVRGDLAPRQLQLQLEVVAEEFGVRDSAEGMAV